MTQKTKILLLFPAPIATIPSGLTYVAKRFVKNGFQVNVHVNTFKYCRAPEAMLKEVIEPYGPDLVGFSYGTFNVLQVFRLQQLCAQKGYFVIAGGNHPSIRPDEALRNGAEVVFRGEAEVPIDEFCAWCKRGMKKSELRGVSGVSYRDGGGTTVHNPKPPRLKDLDALGEMDFSNINLEDFKVRDGSVKGLNVISCGRGCPFQCSYCSHSDWMQYARRSPESIIEEMVGRNERYGITNFWLSDETFVVDKQRVYDFCDRLRRARLHFTWMMGTRISSVDEKLLKAMKESGLVQITYGVESFDDETLKKIRKGYNARRAFEAVTATGKMGIPMYINLMTGFPWETPRHVENNIQYIRAVNQYVYCYQLYGAVVPYPDTGIYEEFHAREGFTDFWLQEKYQNAGMVIYQNVVNPYQVSTFFQRNLYDDTYVTEDYFFRFSPEYKRAVARMGLVIGWKAVQAQHRSPWKRCGKFALGYASHVLYHVNPNLEKKIVGSLVRTNRIHDTRLTGRFVKG